jgi:DNA-binding NarL/FixJ family response regulator
MTVKLRILLADDYPGLLKSYRRLLEPRHTVIGCLTEGDEVVAAAQSLQPDAIVLDFAMPGLNGIDACRQIRQTCPQSKVVLITAADDAGIADAASEAGAAAFVSKYRAADELVRVIERVCGVTPSGC